MVDPTPRPAGQRKVDALALLSKLHQDAWVSTAYGGPAHLVPLSIAWVEDRILIAVESTSITSRNIHGSGRARLGVGRTRDVVMIDAVLGEVRSVDDSGALGDAYAAQADWDPRKGGGTYEYLVLAPQRIQAWREVDEIAGRTLMRDGVWLV